MDVLNSILFILHLLALVGGGSVAIAMPLIGRMMGTATPEQRQGFFKLGEMFARIGRVAIGTLVITGGIMIGTKFGGVDGLGAWFWIKMILVVLLIAGIIVSTLTGKRVQAGDASAIPLARQVGMANGIVLLGIVIAAVFTFN